ncbi:uncharacterized protein [Aegilops tauschii subsp. strangulata]|nr:uncharacterized protein LOC109783180 [Aegilops tauschii subsp. strangulata]
MAMAAASLGSAASRIGGRALQRAAGQARLLFTRARTLTAAEQKYAAARLSNIQLKKEQLYDLIAECEKKYPKSAPRNVKLLQQISEQVESRRGDPIWRSCRRWALANFCNELAGTLFLGTLTANAMTYSYQKMYPREGNNDQKMDLDEGLKSVLPS